mmetsp:Transcript_69108/g.167110  ORF Transcript_69108/g.167110 Transcript_69108/m.167110 type:complete len:270 (-) Transcript_69108:226-1035(-)
MARRHHDQEPGTLARGEGALQCGHQLLLALGALDVETDPLEAGGLDLVEPFAGGVVLEPLRVDQAVSVGATNGEELQALVEARFRGEHWGGGGGVRAVPLLRSVAGRALGLQEGVGLQCHLDGLVPVLGHLGRRHHEVDLRIAPLQVAVRADRRLIDLLVERRGHGLREGGVPGEDDVDVLLGGALARRVAAVLAAPGLHVRADDVLGQLCPSMRYSHLTSIGGDVMVPLGSLAVQRGGLVRGGVVFRDHPIRREAHEARERVGGHAEG